VNLTTLRPGLFLLPFSLALAPVACAQHRATPAPARSIYEKDGSLAVPTNYRGWIFLSSGIDMVYGPLGSQGMGHSMFDNVFVKPEAYRSFLAHGVWPDKTLLVLEIRAAATNPSINNGGHSQGPEVMGLEIHVKDSARFAGNWAFFDVSSPGNLTQAKAKLIPQPAACYTCHAEHAAADTTFVQFYPTLLPVAKEKGTLSAAYLKEFGAAAAAK
jgi:hypothetical protein